VTPEAIVEFTETLARIAASGGGPKALAAHLARVTGGVVLLEDVAWRHLASAGSGRIPASARPTVEAGAPGRAQRVAAGDHHFGWLSLFGGNSEIEAPVLLRLTAAVVGVELARDAVHSRKDNFWQALIGSAFHDATAIRDDAAAREIVLAPSYVVVALEAEMICDGPRTALADELRAIASETFRSDADLGLLEEGGTLLVCVPSGRAIEASNAKTAATLLPKNAARRKPQLRISGGVGSLAPLTAIARSAGDAQTALAIGRRVYGAGRVVAYDDLGAYSLLYEGADVQRLREFASEVLAPLRNYDEKHQTELQKTLKTYFQLGQNVKTAAAALNVHRHTVFYRLRQIAEICARSLESPHDQLTLRLAVAIDELNDAS
jgi:sugar diacid utilization regulator